MRSKNALTMNKWYNIELIRVNHKAEMIINVVNSSKGQSGHKFVYLDLDKNAYLGGLEKPTDE